MKGVLQRLARVHALRRAPSLSSLDALVDGRHVSVASDLVGEFDQAGAPLHLGHGQQGGDGAHGRAPQLLLLLELLLHRTGLHLWEGGGEVTSASSHTFTSSPRRPLSHSTFHFMDATQFRGRRGQTGRVTSNGKMKTTYSSSSSCSSSS